MSVHEPDIQLYKYVFRVSQEFMLNTIYLSWTTKGIWRKYDNIVLANFLWRFVNDDVYKMSINYLPHMYL